MASRISKWSSRPRDSRHGTVSDPNGRDNRPAPEAKPPARPARRWRRHRRPAHPPTHQDYRSPRPRRCRHPTPAAPAPASGRRRPAPGCGRRPGRWSDRTRPSPRPAGRPRTTHGSPRRQPPAACPPALVIEVAADEPRRDPQRPARLHHQQRKVPARPAACGQGLQRRVRALRISGIVGEACVYGTGHRHQHVHRARRAMRVQEAARPTLHHAAGIGMLPLQQAREVRRLVGRVAERVGLGGRVERQVAGGVVVVEVQRGHDAYHPRQRPVPIQVADRVAEHVMRPPRPGRRRRDGQRRASQPQVVRVARTKHQPVRRRAHRLMVGVLGRVRDAYVGQGRSRIPRRS